MRQAGASTDTQGHVAEVLGPLGEGYVHNAWQLADHLMRWATSTGQDALCTYSQSSSAESAGTISETLASGRHG